MLSECSCTGWVWFDWLLNYCLSQMDIVLFTFQEKNDSADFEDNEENLFFQL